MTNLNIIVSGGAGFIGSHITDALIERGHKVYILDDLSSGNERNINSKANLEIADIRSEQAAKLVERIKPQVIYHLAAQLDVRKSVYDPSFDAKINICGALNLLEAGRKSGLKQVIFSSSGGAIYGDQECYPADETHSEWPLSPYGITKLSLEKYLFYYYKQYGIDAACLRYANVYGPRQNALGEGGVIAVFSSKLLKNIAPAIYGDGENTRDFVYVKDVVDVNLAVLQKQGYHIYNVGTGIEATVNRIYQILCDITGSKLAPKYEAPRPGEVRRSSLSAKKIEKELGVSSSTPIEIGFKETVDWFRKQMSQSKL